MIKSILDFLKLDAETQKTRKSTQKLTFGVTSILMICAAVMSVINFMNKSDMMLWATILLTGIFLVCALLCIFKYDGRVLAWILGITIVSVFSFFVLIGGNEGVAIEWILLVPVAYMVLFGLTGGLFVGGYFFVFLIVIFWTPIYQYIPYNYTNEIRMRFPIIYICCFFLAGIIGIRNKRLQLAQNRNEEMLAQAILDERKRVEMISLEAISSVSRALDAKDTYTMEHSDHVAVYACQIAEKLGWNEEKIEELRKSAKVHDIGKIGIPDSILKKESSLTEEEFGIMKKHVEIGADIISFLNTMPELGIGVKYHHERYDGNGYMKGEAGEEIPIEGRIIAVADAIDAMASDRVYRKKRSKEYLIQELQNGAGKQFDPELVQQALRLIEEGMLEKTAHISDKTG